MHNWLAYCGAFACAVGAAMLVYFAAFSVLMSGSGYGLGGFVLLAVIAPVLAGLGTFGVTHSAFAKRSLGIEGWSYGLALVAVVTAACSGLIIADVLEEVPAALLLVASLFVGGRWMIQRTAND